MSPDYRLIRGRYAVENPGLKRHEYVKVSFRRTSMPPASPGPKAYNIDPINAPISPVDVTTRTDLETPPPPTGVSTPDPASATNGAPAVLSPGAQRAKVDRMKQPGQGSTGNNPAWAEAHQNVQQKMMDRRQAASEVRCPACGGTNTGPNGTNYGCDDCYSSWDEHPVQEEGRVGQWPAGRSRMLDYVAPERDMFDRLSARAQERRAAALEHPLHQAAQNFTWDDAMGQSFDDVDPDLDAPESELDDVIPERMSLRDHATLMRNGLKWDGTTRHPKYEDHIWRSIKDSEGNAVHAQEGHVIQHNTNNSGPVLPSDDHDEPEPHPLEYPYTYTHYPAGVHDDGGLVAGHNTVDSALRDKHQLALWGEDHPKSQELLQRYRYLGDETPYRR